MHTSDRNETHFANKILMFENGVCYDWIINVDVYVLVSIMNVDV